MTIDDAHLAVILIAAAEAGVILVTDLLACAEGALATVVTGIGLGLLGLGLGRHFGLGLHVFILRLGLGLRRRGRIDVELHHGLGLLLVLLGLLDGLLLGSARLGGVAALSSRSGVFGGRLLSGAATADLLVGGGRGLATGGGGLLGGICLTSGRCGTSHCEVMVVVVVGNNEAKSAVSAWHANMQTRQSEIRDLAEASRNFL